jgi:hypothetical protein
MIARLAFVRYFGVIILGTPTLMSSLGNSSTDSAPSDGIAAACTAARLSRAAKIANFMLAMETKGLLGEEING